ncbi:MAG: Holliday junction branch migration protein RuvA [Anaplasmataceae bacterium]|nr:Holliday junction branch migration protein RuvA [Anaplasmataceae bacterium]
MIGKLNGTIEDYIDDYLILDVSGVGYIVYTTDNIKIKYSLNNQLKLYIFHNIKENINKLYGFMTKDELNYFNFLISINGVSCKIAMNILNHITLDTLLSSIHENDKSFLNKIPGIGKVLANRIISELKLKKLPEITIINEQGNNYSKINDVLLALKGLGYKEDQIMKIVNKIDNKDDLNTEELTTLVLMKIGS